MKLYYSDHSKKRMQQRNISSNDIECAIQYGELTSKKSTEKTSYFEYDDLKVVISKNGTLITAFKDENYNLKSEIKELSQEADDMASQFKHYLSSATDAYSSGFKSHAKEYSLIGREIQYNCQLLNDYINSLRQTFKNRD